MQDSGEATPRTETPSIEPAPIEPGVVDGIEESIDQAAASALPVEAVLGVADPVLDAVPAWAGAVILLGGAVVAAVFVQIMLYAILGFFTDHDGRPNSKRLVTKTRIGATVLAAAIGVRFGSALVAGWSGRTGALGEAISGGFIEHASTVAIILAITWIAIGLISAIDDMILARYRVDVRDNLHARRMHTQIGVISKTLMILVGLAGVSIALMTFDAVERFGASLLASAGIAGIVVGFAARPVLGNIIAGVQIALTQPIRIDDAVVIEGEWGWIEEITVTYVVVRIWDERRLIVPFSKIIEEPFQNWTRRSANILGSVFLHVDYTCPVGEVRAELERALKANDKWDGRAWVLQVTEATDRTIQLRALMTAADSPTAWDLRCEIREHLIAFLQREHPDALPRTRSVWLEGESDSAGAGRSVPEQADLPRVGAPIASPESDAGQAANDGP